MNLYRIVINEVPYDIKASSPWTACYRAVKKFYQDHSGERTDDFNLFLMVKQRNVQKHD